MTIIRAATANDAGTIRQMILDLAEFQKHGTEVRASAGVLSTQLASDTPPFECLIAEIEGKPVGFALFYGCYSTWEGQSGLYLEDLFVYPHMRGLGVGKALLSRLSEIAEVRGCTRIDWMVEDSNQQAQNFYSNLGARMLPDWTRWRFELSPSAGQPV